MPNDMRTRTILLVDDCASHQETTQLILEAEGCFSVMTASTGQEGLRQARALKPDLVLLDVMLPDASGYDICQELKMDPELMDIVVLLFSALGGRSKERTIGLEFGADGYLKKPVEPEELVATVHALLRIRYAEQRAQAAKADATTARTRLAAITESSDLAIINTDPEGTVLGWNPAAERLFGYTAEEVLGCSVGFLMLPESGEEWRKVWMRVRDGNLVRGYDTRHRARDGASLSIFVNVCPVRDEQGKVVGVTEVAWSCPTPLGSADTLVTQGI